MSTFSRDNGPFEGFDFQLWRGYIDGLRKDITELQNLIPSKNYGPGNTVEGDIDKVEAALGQLKVKVDAFAASFTTDKFTVPGYIDATGQVLNFYKDLYFIKDSANRIPGIDVGKITMGPELSFKKYYSVSIGVGDDQSYYALAELNRISDLKTNDPTITLSSIIFVYNNADPKATAVIQATENGLTVLHSGRAFQGTPGAFKAEYAVWRTGGNDNNYHYYIGMRLLHNDSPIRLAQTNLQVAMINAIPVNDNVGLATRVAYVYSKDEAAFLVTKLNIADLVVDDMKAGKIAVSGTAEITGHVTAKSGITVTGDAALSGNLTAGGNGAFEGDVGILGDVGIGGDFTLAGEAALEKSLQVENDISSKTLTASQYVKTPTIQSYPDGRVMLHGTNSDVEIGHGDKHLNVKSKDRPTHDAQQFAYLSDLATSILFQGRVDHYSNVWPIVIPDPYKISDETPTIPAKWQAIRNKAKCLVILTEEKFKKAYISEYNALNKTWGARTEWQYPPNDETFQWHVDWLSEVDDIHQDTYYHEAEVLWSPYLPDEHTDSRVSIINLPLEDYYNKEQIDEIVLLFYDLSTRQADWLVNRRVVADRRGDGVDNPAYIRNKPVVGLSVLDGGNFPRQDDISLYPMWLVDGGEYNVLGTYLGRFATDSKLPLDVPSGQSWHKGDYAYVDQDTSSTGAAARYRIEDINSDNRIRWLRDITVSDLKNLRQDVMIKVWSGKKENLPHEANRSKYVLKWCYDTRELFIDQYGQPDDGSYIEGNKRLNIPNNTVVVDAALAVGDDPASWDASKRVSVVETLDIADAKGDYQKHWKLISGDSRISFDPQAAPEKDTLIRADLRLNDLLGVTPTSVSAQAPSALAGTFRFTWTTLTRGTIINPAPASEDHYFSIAQGVGLALSSAGTTDIQNTIGLDDTVQAALNTPAVLQVTTAVDAAGTSITLVKNKPWNTNPADNDAESLTFYPGTGMSMESIGSDPKDKQSKMGLDADVQAALNSTVVKSSDSTVSPVLGATFSTVENKNWKPSDPDVNKSLTIKPGPHIVMTNTTSGATPLLKEATIDVDPVIAAAAEKFVLSNALLNADNVLVFTRSQLSAASPDTSIGLLFEVGNGLEMTISEAAGTISMGYKVPAGTVSSQGQYWIQNAAFADAADGGITLALTSYKFDDPAAAPVVNSLSLVPGPGMTFSSTGDAQNRVLTVGAKVIEPSDYTTENFASNDGVVTGSVQWARSGDLIHAQIFIGMGLGNAQDGYFPTALSENARPAILVRSGDASTRNITIGSDGAIHYYLYEMGAYYTSITYFAAN
jgi:hypothetical protein